jgi:hypothetical protein
MTITPGELLETSIAQLRTLVAFLGEQLAGSAGGDTAQSSRLEVRACKNMLVSLTVILQDTPGLGPGGEHCRAKLNSNHRGQQYTWDARCTGFDPRAK